jgi:hypothetical protein
MPKVWIAGTRDRDARGMARMKTISAYSSLTLELVRESGGLDFDHTEPRAFEVMSPHGMPSTSIALPWRRATILGIAMLALSVSALAYSAGAQDDAGKIKVPAATPASSKPPLPPTRRTGLPPTSVTAQPSGTSNSTGPRDSSAKNPDTRAPAEDPASNPYQVRTLQPASRARMHECGAEWQQLKASGAAGEKTWYTFAQSCLTR